MRRRQPALLALAAALAWAAPGLAAGAYVGATADTTGEIRIAAGKGRTIVVARDSGQVGSDRIAISEDGRSVGWLALYPNCCTSYPIPLRLRIHTRGRTREFTGVGLPIWRWRFVAGGRQVAFQQETVHGGLGVPYELRDVASGRLVAAYHPPVTGDNRTLPPGEDAPAWVRALEAKP
ncbi:MAG: hypothetical protein ACRENJ_09440 [Candidatus Eiseniibacteriota bacterium]